MGPRPAAADRRRPGEVRSRAPRPARPSGASSATSPPTPSTSASSTASPRSSAALRAGGDGRADGRADGSSEAGDGARAPGGEGPVGSGGDGPGVRWSRPRSVRWRRVVRGRIVRRAVGVRSPADGCSPARRFSVTRGYWLAPSAGVRSRPGGTTAPGSGTFRWTAPDAPSWDAGPGRAGRPGCTDPVGGDFGPLPTGSRRTEGARPPGGDSCRQPAVRHALDPPSTGARGGPVERGPRPREARSARPQRRRDSRHRPTPTAAPTDDPHRRKATSPI